MPSSETRGKSGFTLIELLVVIAIIAILAAILFPVFARAREQAQKSSCISNVRQLGMAVVQYVPTSGDLGIEGQETAGLSERALTRLRRERIGFVFQHFGLVPTLTVAENVALPALFSRRRAGERVEELLRRFGLERRRDHRPHQLSGGEMQRVAIARALVNEPHLLLADEPTGNLDSATGGTVIELLKRLHRDGLTVVVVTHNDLLAAQAERRLELVDGRGPP